MPASATKILLITLGNSPMIVPQAFLGYGVNFDEVHVFTTDNARLHDHVQTLQSIFQQHYPHVIFSVTASRGIELPNDTQSHSHFEEALYQWYILRAGNLNPYVCITGGTKTIPATMQQAARYFGASDVFHVIADMPSANNPKNLEEVEKAISEGKLKFICLGAEPGWYHFRHITSKSRFSAETPDPVTPGLVWKEKTMGFAVAGNIRHILSVIQSSATDTASKSLPFGILRLLPPEIENGLNSPLDGQTDREWIAALPKAELHCHLGGFATHGSLLQEVRGAATYSVSTNVSVPALPDGWPLPVSPIPLSYYMKLGDANGSALLKDKGCLRKQIQLLYEHFMQQNIRYAEVRCSPDNYTSSDRTSWQVLQNIINTFQQLMDSAFEKDETTACQVNILVIATRKREGDLSSISRHLALAITAAQGNAFTRHSQCRVVGVDLAGYEDKDTRPAYFANDFIGVHRSGIAVTAHAGENDDAESIWQAVYQLQARRIGHALQLYEAKDLMRTMAERRIGIEMCPYANYQIKGYVPMKGCEKNYPLLDYMKAGIPVTVNTDNIGISGAGLSENYLLLSQLCPGITRLQVLQLIRNSLEVAFVHPTLRQKLLGNFEKQVFEACVNLK